jgi:hypothetical protein
MNVPAISNEIRRYDDMLTIDQQSASSAPISAAHDAF